MSVPDFRHTRFLLSAPTLKHAPTDQGAEVAFAGRSNAGKSSALNAITGVKALARASKTPGRTQLLNFFEASATTRLVDLPGYGFARIPPEVKKTWERMVMGYLERRKSLVGLFLVMDARQPLTPLDQVLIGWCRDAGLAIHILLTKADKLSRGEARETLRKVAAEVTPLGITIQLFSATSGEGRDEARAKLADWLGDFGQKKGPGNKGKESGA